MISDKQLEDKLFTKLQFLATTDETAAELEVAAIRAKRKMEAIGEALFLAMEGSVDSKWAQAKRDSEYVKAEADYFDAELSWKKVKNERGTANEAIGGIRSLMANRRQGQI